MESALNTNAALPCRLNGLFSRERNLATLRQRAVPETGAEPAHAVQPRDILNIVIAVFALPCRVHRASAKADDLEAALHEKTELLQQKQDASSDRQIALHGELLALEQRMPALQKKLDLAKWRGRDTQYLSRQLCTVHNSRVEAMLELQAL